MPDDKSSRAPATGLKGLRKLRSGKVRDLYDLGDSLLIVATDRISAFDVVLPDEIPDKGKVLNQLSAFWFERLHSIIPNHMITIDANQFPSALADYRLELSGRAMLVRKAQPLPVECVVRGYLAGSGWADYRRSGSVCGIQLPGGLEESDRLPEPIFTPATKAESGHDQNITFSEMVKRIGADLAEQLKSISLKLYVEAQGHAETRGIIIADTKFEFGLEQGQLILIDETLTPDSSRFWLASQWRRGSSPPSLDKQFVRDFLTQIGWNRQPPAPELPYQVIEGTRQRYLDVFRRLTGTDCGL
ncbi:MAG: phosphoribosylaminoimidazolesuccinocarboxamide synthase [candidate division WOR-3 bacterium]